MRLISTRRFLKHLSKRKIDFLKHFDKYIQANHTTVNISFYYANFLKIKNLKNICGLLNMQSESKNELNSIIQNE